MNCSIFAYQKIQYVSQFLEEKYMILIGDIGKDKSQLAILSQEQDAKEMARKEFHNQNYLALVDVVAVFLEEYKSVLKDEPIYIACFGIAGPNINGNCQIYDENKLDWKFTVKDLRELLPTADYLKVLNDMPALGSAIPKLSKSDLIDFNDVLAKKGNRAVSLATGEGLGELLLYRDCSGDFLPSPSEGGHANFAPHNDWTLEFSSYLHTQFSPPISWEKVISWESLQTIYEFLQHKKGMQISSISYEDILQRANQNDELCKQALERFASMYGSGLGDLALRTLAVNGVYIGGRMVQEILGQETTKQIFIKEFMNAFKDKEGFDRKRNFAKRNAVIPVKAFINPEMVLLGALQRAKIMANLQ